MILGALVVLALGAEIVYRFSRSSKGCVQIINQADRALDDLVVIYGSTKLTLGRLEPGASANAWFSAGKKGTLQLDFKQKGNPLKGFSIDDFDPADNKRNGLKLVLGITNNRVERSMDDDDTKSEMGSLIDRVKVWIEEDVAAPR
jgi:hypothetical protein